MPDMRTDVPRLHLDLDAPGFTLACLFPTCQVDVVTPLVELFVRTAVNGAECFEVADLGEVVHYLMKSQYLVLPQDWANAL